jgi:hypothetical protein
MSENKTIGYQEIQRLFGNANDAPDNSSYTQRRLRTYAPDVVTKVLHITPDDVVRKVYGISYRGPEGAARVLAMKDAMRRVDQAIFSYIDIPLFSSPVLKDEELPVAWVSAA